MEIKLEKVLCDNMLYYIKDKNKNINIGTITFINKNKILFIYDFEIKSEYRNKGYGHKVIDYLLNNFNIDYIIGETLKTARHFWNKIIHEYNGMRKNIKYTSCCSSSFIIPNNNNNPKKMFKNNKAFFNFLKRIYR